MAITNKNEFLLLKVFINRENGCHIKVRAEAHWATVHVYIWFGNTPEPRTWDWLGFSSKWLEETDQKLAVPKRLLAECLTMLDTASLFCIESHPINYLLKLFLNLPYLSWLQIHLSQEPAIVAGPFGFHSSFLLRLGKWFFFAIFNYLFSAWSNRNISGNYKIEVHISAYFSHWSPTKCTPLVHH